MSIWTKNSNLYLPFKWTMYLDANNLHGCAISLKFHMWRFTPLLGVHKWDTKRLMSSLSDKAKCPVHYKVLGWCLTLAKKIKNEHEYIEYNQSPPIKKLIYEKGV